MHITLHTRMLLAKTVLLRETQQALLRQLRLTRSQLRIQRMNMLCLQDAMQSAARKTQNGPRPVLVAGGTGPRQF
ncbi:MAG: hypothetical protein DMG67_07680 [Acidobacteria bacterium]|nr:MAG: hypothetical protein DMG67_07680 [Acidobacteriota bacterium]